MKKAGIAALAWLGMAVLSSGAQAANVCGNGVVDGAETCDDGNRLDGDGCAATCGVTPASLTIADAAVTEGDAGTPVLTFTITRGDNVEDAINVGVSTGLGPVYEATPEYDFTAIAAGTRLVIPAGATSATVTVPLLPDDEAEYDETLVVNLENAYQAGAIGLLNATTLGAADGPFAVALADFDGDGVNDMASVSGPAATVAIRRNTTSTPGGAITFSVVNKTVGASPFSLAAGDLDNDGRLDLATVTRTDDTVTVLRNTSSVGALSFADPVTFPAGTGAEAVAIGDLDSDGRADLAVARLDAQGLSVLLNATTGDTLAFADAVSFAGAGQHRRAAVADLNGDGKPEVTLSSDAGLTYLRNTTSGGTLSFDAPWTLAAGTNPDMPVHADFDGDGRLDVAVANTGSDNITVMHNRSGSAGGLGWASENSHAVGDQPRFLAVGDIDGDGKPDLVANNGNGSSISVLRNTSVVGDINFAARQDYGVGLLPFEVAVGDLDRDGQLDVATAVYSPDVIAINRNYRPAATLADAQATGTIVDDDEPVVAFATTAGAAPEAPGAIEVTVRISGVRDDSVTVAYSLGGTATEGDDYSMTPSSLTFAPDETEKSFVIDGLDDQAADGAATESVVITLADPANAVLGAASAYTLTIDNDPEVSFAAASDSVAETAGGKVLTVTLNKPWDAELVVDYTLGGDAVEGADYAISPAALAFAPGETTATLTISGLADAAADGGPESLVVTLQPSANATPGGIVQHTLTITDDSLPPPAPPAPAPAGGGGGGSPGGLLLAVLGIAGLRRRR